VGQAQELLGVPSLLEVIDIGFHWLIVDGCRPPAFRRTVDAMTRLVRLVNAALTDGVRRVTTSTTGVHVVRT
jgi:hypothetical protein